MHPEILSKNQQELLPLIKKLSAEFYLVGGTALALQLGHRQSIDFDLFTDKEFNNESVIKKARQFYPLDKTFIKAKGQMTVMIHDVKMTWYQFPFVIPHKIFENQVIAMPDVLTIAAMKIYALGQRAKWKDYVDLYFIFKQYSMREMVEKAKKLFGEEINERLLREQLNYFADIDYSEQVKYLPGMDVNDEVVKRELKKIAVS